VIEQPSGGSQFQSRTTSTLGETSSYFHVNNGLARHASIASFPMSQVSPPANTVQESAYKPSVPLANVDSNHMNIDIPMYNPGNAAFIEKFNQNSEPLPPRRTLPFARPTSV